MQVVLVWRERVNKALEPFRAAKHKSTDAKVTLHASGADGHTLHDFDSRHPGQLADLLIVSAVAVVNDGTDQIEVAEHGGHRCERCWKWFAALPAAPGDVCDRCVTALPTA